MSVVNPGNIVTQPITSPGPEFIYLTSAETEDDLNSIKCANQVHFKSYSSKNCWTKYECERSSSVHGKCKFLLLAASCDPNDVHRLFNIYFSGVHNHEVEQSERVPSRNIMQNTENSVVNNDDDIQILSDTIFENSNTAETSPTNQPALNEIRKKFPFFRTCQSFNHLENLRRSEGLLIDKQFNVVNGIPEVVYYRCKINLQCPFTLQAVYNNKTGFFELYAPLNNNHFHSSSSDPNSSSNNVSVNGNLQQNFTMEGIMPCSSNMLNGESIKLKRRLINVNLSEWNYIGEYQNEEAFEILRVQRKVSPLRERGKQFLTLRQQTLKCYFRKPEKGKCRYRMLIFREWDGQPAQVYEKGVHNHKPKPLKQSEILSIEQAKQYYESIMSSFIQQNPENNSSLPLQIPQQQNCYTPTTSKEGNNNGKISNCDSWKINGMRNIGWRFSLASCFSELRTLADGFLLDLSCTEESMVFKRRDNRNTFLIVSECGPHKEGLNVEECRNGCFSDHSEQWIKGDKLQFIRAMRTRIHEFMEQRNL